MIPNIDILRRRSEYSDRMLGVRPRHVVALSKFEHNKAVRHYFQTLKMSGSPASSHRNLHNS